MTSIDSETKVNTQIYSKSCIKVLVMRISIDLRIILLKNDYPALNALLYLALKKIGKNTANISYLNLNVSPHQNKFYLETVNWS